MDFNQILDILFQSAKVMGIPLLAYVIGLVQWVKDVLPGDDGSDLHRRLVKGASMGIGVLLGIGYQASVATVYNFSMWFGSVLFGVLLGLVASGVYDAAKEKKKL